MSHKNLEEKLTVLDGIIAEHQGKPDALIRVLQEAQSLLDYLPNKVLDHIAGGLEIPPGEVYTLASIYPEVNTKPDPGRENPSKHRLCVCKGTSCYIRGANEVLDRVCKELHVEPGRTTPGGEFSLDIVRCVGACALGPVITLDDAVYPRTTPERVSDILDKYKE